MPRRGRDSLSGKNVASIAVANPVPVAGPRCDGVVCRWPLGSGALSRALNLADAHGLLARSDDPSRPDLHRDSPRQRQRRPRNSDYSALSNRPSDSVARMRRWHAAWRTRASMPSSPR